MPLEQAGGRHLEPQVSVLAMKRDRHATTEKLVREAKAGSRDAATALFEQHWPHIWRVAYRVLGRQADADDVAQEAFVAAFAHLDRFEGRSSFRTWVTRIAINRALNLLRADKSRLGGWVEATEAAGDGDNAASELMEAVARLPLERRVVLVMRYWLGCPIDEIAEFLGIPTGTVNSRLARALRDVRADLEVSRCSMN
jgi:RNA polymerase sigma-70 factor, ECF subfamily